MIRNGEQGLSKDQELFHALAKAHRVFICMFYLKSYIRLLLIKPLTSHFLTNTQNSVLNRGELSVRIVKEPGYVLPLDKPRPLSVNQSTSA
jgi:hypothetical protein